MLMSQVATKAKVPGHRELKIEQKPSLVKERKKERKEGRKGKN